MCGVFAGRSTGSQDISTEFEVRLLVVMFRGLHRGISKRKFLIHIKLYIICSLPVIVSYSIYSIRFKSEEAILELCRHSALNIFYCGTREDNPREN